MKRISYDAVALLSGGLDSLLAAKILEEQGLRVKCLHFITPFFGKADLLEQWKTLYGLDIEFIDVSREFIRMLHSGPEHGFGKTLNPCVDCKILMLRHARAKMERYGARMAASGEVLGQRPMSQRRDTLDIIRNESGLREALVRPLSAALLPAGQAEREGLVDRSRMYGIAGRGRSAQLRLAHRYGILKIPTPAGGCLLTERAKACRYWPLLNHMPESGPAEFHLANTGRQFWAHTPDGIFWLCVGRNAADNERLEKLTRSEDMVFRLRDMPGPMGVARPLTPWPEYATEDAARLVASYAPRAEREGRAVMRIRCRDVEREICVAPARPATLPWGVPAWEKTREAIRAAKDD